MAMRAMDVASLIASGAMATLNTVNSRDPIRILIKLIVAGVGAYIG